MPTYAIGDVQGCFAELNALLEKIHFHPDRDTLWFTGDLVNRGPQSLEVLRFVKSLGHKHIVVLGNHDLHLLAAHYGVGRVNHEDTFEEILAAPDRQELMDWLRYRPLVHFNKEMGFIMSHAGLAPAWTAQQAVSLAREVETLLRSDTPAEFLKQMYGNQPDRWDDHLTGIERWRCIINYFTRMRFCHLDGRLNLTYKGEIAGKPDDLIPWFDVADRACVGTKIVFGHWAALNGKTNTPNVYALDTGCVWGNCMTAMRLEDEERFSVKCG